MIIITLNAKGARVTGVESAINELLKKKYPGCSISVTRKNPATSRADRFSEATTQVEDAKSTAEELKSELEEWQGNLPENLQSGDKASQLEEAISQLDEFISNCEDAAGIEVEFPGMY